MKSYFEMSAAADHRIRHPLSDLTLLEADLDEIAARAAATKAPETAAALDHEGIWARVNGRSPKAQAERPAPKGSATTVDTEEVWRRYNGSGPDPERVLVRK